MGRGYGGVSTSDSMVVYRKFFRRSRLRPEYLGGRIIHRRGGRTSRLFLSFIVAGFLGLFVIASTALADQFLVQAYPLDGGALVDSPSAIPAVTGTMTDGNPNTSDRADYVMRSGPGTVFLSQNGLYDRGPTVFALQPTTTAAAVSTIVFSGPGPNVSTQVSVDVSGRLQMTCLTVDCGDAVSNISVNLNGRPTSVAIRLSAPLPGQEESLTVDRSVPGVVSFSGRLTTPLDNLPTGVAMNVRVEATIQETVFNATWDAQVMVTFPGAGPVFELPDGYTANGTNVTNNIWTDPFAIMVTSTADSGPGSLRQAILDANAELVVPNIRLMMPGPGPHTITPLTPLPDIRCPMVLNAASNLGADGSPTVELSGGALLSGGDGLHLTDSGCVVQGLAIYGFAGAGIRAGGTGSHVIQHNFIGIAPPGTIAIPNGVGILVESGNNLIGGSAPGEGNLISGNTGGGIIMTGVAAANVIQGNLIGTDISGLVGLGSQFVGVDSLGGGNEIGDPTPGAGNVIAFNSLYGVRIQAGVANRIRGNSIFNNGLGIDLSPVGVTPNDIGDSDIGPNNLQNFPLITKVLNDGQNPNVAIIVTLDSTPNATFLLDFYANAACNPSGHGEGRRYLGAMQVAIGAGGQASFSFTPGGPALTPSEFVTATATDAAGSTSEFSPCAVVPPPPPASLLVTTTADSGLGSLRQAILDANATVGTDPVAIHFAIPGGPPYTITLNSGLPVITRPVIIDGTTQPGFAGAPVVHIENSFGSLTLASSNSVVRGLSITTSGIWLAGEGGHVVQGNYLGVMPSGAPWRFIFEYGIIVASDNNLIGGTSAGLGNLISGQLVGIIIEDPYSNRTVQGTVIQGNLIGTDPTGRNPLVRQANGIHLSKAANTQIGGTQPGAGNVIAFNFNSGITVSQGTGNQIRGNSIFSNGDHGIDLYGTQDAFGGVSLNDPGDLDAGPNNLQNFPIITEVITFAGETSINGTLNSTPNAVFTLDFYANAERDPSYFGEGERYLGATTVTTDAAGNAGFGFRLPPGVPILAPTDIVTATATDGTGNTSEFSEGVGFQPLPPLLVTTTSDSGPGSLRDAILKANTLSAGPVRIHFAIPGGPPHIIPLDSNLPNLTRAIEIDATTQQGFAGSPIVHLQGSLPYIDFGLILEAPYCIVRGLAFSRMSLGIGVIAGGATIQGNYIGVDPSGTYVPILQDGVFQTGIQLGDLAPIGSLIGGPNPGEGNLISGNNMGISLGGPDNVIQGNLIGTDPTGQKHVGGRSSVNFFVGIRSFSKVLGNIIGGTSPGAGNVIAFNHLGIYLGGVDFGNQVRGNAIFSNEILGIGLGGGGPTPNDAGDVDTGPNNLQNFPILSPVQDTRPNLVLSGTLNSTPNETFTLDFYTNSRCHPSGYGEGERYLGETQVTTDALGQAVFNFGFTDSGFPRSVYTATATDAAGNTSEFSPCTGPGAISNGDLSLIGDPTLVDARFLDLVSIAGSLIFSDNPAATGLFFGSLMDTSGDFIVTNNPVLTTLDASLLATVGGSLTVTNNPLLGSINLNSLTTVGVNLTLETQAVNEDLANVAVTGNIDITGIGTQTLRGLSGDGSTAVTLLNPEAALQALLPAGTFAAPVGFTIEHLDPTALPLELGVDVNNVPVNVGPVAAYRLAFDTPTLNQEATIAIDTNVATLGDPAGFLAALDNGQVTLASKAEGAGSVYQTAPICGSGQTPAPGGCVSVTLLDAGGVVLPPGSPTTPAVVRFMGLTGHFSTWAVAITTPIDVIPPVLTGVPGPITAEATGPAGAAVTYTPPSANDAVSGPAPVSCQPPSNSPFPLGSTAVICTATDGAGNSASASFTVTVSDTTPPTLSGVPVNMTVPATGPDGAVVTWPNPTATDAVSGILPVVCAPPSGSNFPVGNTAVACTATDGAGNSRNTGFLVTVQVPPPAASMTVCTVLGEPILPDVDLFQFQGSKGETVSVTLSPDPAAAFTGGSVRLLLFGNGLLRSDATALPNTLTAKLPKTGTYSVTVSELLLQKGKFSGGYCLRLESSGNAWQSFRQR